MANNLISLASAWRAQTNQATQDFMPWYVWVILIVFTLIVILWWYFNRQEPKIKGGHDEHVEHGHDHTENPASHDETAHAAPVMEMAAEKAGAEVPVTLAEAETTEPPKPDDLKIIEGIGPKVAGVLNAAGIFTFAQLAAASLDSLRAILDAAEYQYMDPTSWIQQARLAGEGQWEALQELQDSLKGGRT